MLKIAALMACAAALAGCGGSSDTGIISSATAQTVAPSSGPPALPDPKYLQQLTAYGSSGGMAGAAGPATKDVGGPTIKIAPGAWNTVTPAYCVGQLISGVFYIFVTGRDGSVTWSADPNAVSMITTACVSNSNMAFMVSAVSGSQYLWSAMATYHP